MTLNFIFELLNPMKFDHAGIDMETMPECLNVKQKLGTRNVLKT